MDKVVGIVPEKPKADFSWTEKFTVSIETAEKYNAPEWLYENLIISGHVIAIPAPPNGGKTTIMMFIARALAKKGKTVFYVNSDVGQGDVKQMLLDANANNFKLLLPDMNEGLSMTDVIDGLELQNNNGGDFSEQVFIFDTLKKMTDVINKSKAKGLYKLLRSLSAKGMTIILLAHTNKYNDSEGKPIFEGTGDLRADVDELIYFIPKKNDDGSMTVSTDPDKVRGKFEPITFKIDSNRNVTLLPNFIDVALIKKTQSQMEKDLPTVEAITEAIKAKNIKQVEIIEFCKQYHIGKRSVQAVLKRYAQGENLLWKEEKGFQHNTRFYHLCDESIPPYRVGKVATEQSGQSETTKPNDSK